MKKIRKENISPEKKMHRLISFLFRTKEVILLEESKSCDMYTVTGTFQIVIYINTNAR